MRYLLLSVLVVCVIGIMVPSVFADKIVIVQNTPGSSAPGCEETAGGCFIPNPVIISVGGVVTWENNDTAPHTITSGTPTEGPDGHFDSSLFKVGYSFTHIFNDPGTFDYFCMVHPWMVGTVIVNDGSTTPSAPPSPTVTTGEPAVQDSYGKTAYFGSQTHLQEKLDEYWNCGTDAADSGYNQDCIKFDEKHRVGISFTEIADYRIEKDGTLTFTYEDSNISKKLEKFRDQNLHQQLWDMYTSITPPQIMSEIVYFVIWTDDYYGDEAASVLRDIDYPLKFDLSVDPVDMVPSGIKIDKQYYIATLIHENAHILSLSANQSDNKGLPAEAYDSAYKFKQHMTEGEEGCDNYYNDMVGCMDKNSYLNAFFQKFWAGIYHDFKWLSEFDDYDTFYEHNTEFFWKYEKYWLTDYSAENPDEDFAEAFMTFVLKEKPNSPTFAEQKILFFYQYPELVEMRDFIRSAIATSEFCDNGTVWKDGKCQKKSFTAQLGVKDSDENVLGEASGCLIATAAFGSEMAPQVQLLREIRDNTVLQTESGTSFMTGFNQFYYSFSPYIADYERENPAFKETVKLALTPLLASLTLLQYVDIDSESEMLGYGIGVIMLNIGMYFVAPAVLIMAVRKRI